MRGMGVSFLRSQARTPLITRHTLKSKAMNCADCEKKTAAQGSAFGGFQRGHSLFKCVDALVEIAGSRPHDHHHRRRVAPIPAVQLLKPIQPPVDGSSKLAH